MRLTVRASEVREGDRLIVPNGEGERLTTWDGVTSLVWFRGSDSTLVIGVPLDERVVVERPAPPITITVELTREEAQCFRNVREAATGDGDNLYSRTLDKVYAAIVAARAGETTP